MKKILLRFRLRFALAALVAFGGLAHGLAYDPALDVGLANRDLQAAQQVLAPLLALPEAPTALFVDNDVAAITMLKS